MAETIAQLVKVNQALLHLRRYSGRLVEHERTIHDYSDNRLRYYSDGHLSS